MGADPATMSMIAAMFGSQLLGGIMAPQGQNLQSFEGVDGVDPRTMLGEGKGMIDDLLGSLVDQANAPVTLHTTVNPLPNFHGGALPMSVSAPGMDANRLNPDLRTTQPVSQIPRRRLSAVTGGSNGVDENAMGGGSPGAHSGPIGDFTPGGQNTAPPPPDRTPRGMPLPVPRPAPKIFAGGPTTAPSGVAGDHDQAAASLKLLTNIFKQPVQVT